MNTYRLRVEQALDAASDDVARAISDLGGTVVSVDLREVERTVAVDEIIVAMPSEVDGGRLRAVLEESSNTVLLSSKSCEADAPREQALRWARETDNEPERCQGDLPQSLSAACPLADVWLYDRRDAESFPAVWMTLTRGAPVVHLTTTFPHRFSSHQPRSPRWLLAVPDCFPDARTVALLTRPTRWRFTAPEVARVQLLMAS
jgi:hypothetical protein